MKKYNAKSIVIGRKHKDSKNDDCLRPCFISLFNVNDPQRKNKAPDKILDFENIEKVVIKNLDVSYLLHGNDIVINNLEFITVKESGSDIEISGKQV